MDQSGPIDPSSRIEVLDALRGFALFGIVVVNFLSFAEWWPQQSTDAGDLVASFAATWLGTGKFYSLFALLFGIGFAILISRRGEGGLGHHTRRIGILLLIGLAHLSLLWAGDILTLYALLGFLLPAFRHASDRTLVWTAGGLTVLPVAWHAAVVAAGGAIDIGGALIALSTTPEYAAVADPLWRAGELLQSGRPAKVFAMFLLGVVVARRFVAGSGFSRATLARVVVAGASVGLPANALLAWMRHDGVAGYASWSAVADTAVYAAGVVPLALAYAAAFVLAWNHWRGRQVLGLLAPAGRMALTNYLAQTVVGLALFYAIAGHGLWLAGELGAVPVIVLAAATFVAQTVVSAVWLGQFRYGPAEWLWRCATYRRLEPLRAVPASSAAVVRRG